MSIRVRGDFNGLFALENGGLLLCLSHSDTATDESGNDVQLSDGMQITAFDLDTDEEGRPTYLLATGTVIESPEALKCRGSKWSLIADERGCYEELRIEV